MVDVLAFCVTWKFNAICFWLCSLNTKPKQINHLDHFSQFRCITRPILVWKIRLCAQKVTEPKKNKKTICWEFERNTTLEFVSIEKKSIRAIKRKENTKIFQVCYFARNLQLIHRLDITKHTEAIQATTNKNN